MNINSTVGKSRFLFYLNQLQDILEKAESSDNPALSIYSQNARTPLFMLEGLTRIYKKMHNKKKFRKLNILFKDFEDRLGSIDFYDGFYHEFENDKRMPELIASYANDKKEDTLKTLKEDLKKSKWIGKNKKRISKIIKQLNKIDWLDEKEDTREILNVYQHYIDKITEKYQVKNIHFTDLESDVHELRRELRWLSIYPQALRGLMQFKEDSEPKDFLKKYLTPEIVSSPYNVMPDGSGLREHILLDKNYFYALSWMIDALGKLKDSGLTITAIEEALGSVYHISHGKEQLAYSICGDSQMKLPEILIQSQAISTTFFEEDILQKLLSDSQAES